MKKTIDVFMTSNEGTEGDEEWMGPVWSVEVTREEMGLTTDPPRALRGGKTVALVANWATPYIMTSIPLEEPHKKQLKVGDLVRVGTPDSRGYTDYLTVMEVIPLDKLGSGITGVIGHAEGAAGVVGPDIVWDADYTKTNFTTLPIVAKEDATENTTRSGGSLTNQLQAASGQFINVTGYVAYRLNYAIDVTTPTVPAHRMLQAGAHRKDDMLEERHLLTISSSWATTALKRRAAGLSFVSNEVETGLFYRSLLYPLFRVKTPPATHKVQLDRGIKAVHWIKLYAATFVNKRAVGFQNAHEMHMDDWVALRLHEVQGEVISNNATANGSFTILHSGHHDDALTGAKEVRLDQDAPGITTVYFERPRTDMRSLTVELRDRYGDLAHLGRIHLWFKLCVSHG